MDELRSMAKELCAKVADEQSRPELQRYGFNGSVPPVASTPEEAIEGIEQIDGFDLNGAEKEGYGEINEETFKSAKELLEEHDKEVQEEMNKIVSVKGVKRKRS